MGIYKLPPELRNQIYDAVIPKGRIITNDKKGVASIHTASVNEDVQEGVINYEPAICRTSKLFREEIIPMYYMEQSFHFTIQAPESETGNFMALCKWLDNLGNPGLEHIRSLDIDICALDVDLDFRLRNNTYSASCCGWFVELWDYEQERDNIHEYYKQARYLLEWIVKRLQDGMKDRKLELGADQCGNMFSPPERKKDIVVPEGARRAVSLFTEEYDFSEDPDDVKKDENGCETTMSSNLPKIITTIDDSNS